MYIYKIIYEDRNIFTEEEYNTLLDNHLIFETDYGTTEILADNVSDNDNLEFEEILRERLGTDVMEKLFVGEIDLILLV